MSPLETLFQTFSRSWRDVPVSPSESFPFPCSLKKILRLFSVIVLVTTLLSGCASKPSYKESLTALPDGVLVDKSSLGKLHIFRDEFYGQGRDSSVFLDGKALGDLPSYSYTTIELPPGSYKISPLIKSYGLLSKQQGSDLSVAIQSGQNTYIRMKMRLSGRVTPIPEFVRVSELEGERLRASLQVIELEWVSGGIPTFLYSSLLGVKKDDGKNPLERREVIREDATPLAPQDAPPLVNSRISAEDRETVSTDASNAPVVPSESASEATQNKVNPSPRRAPRLALLIGNADYRNSPLANPVNDVRGMESVLKKAGFTVIRHENLNYKEMREAVREFGEKLTDDHVGLFYYSGHGVQVDGKNYLIPVNSDIKYEDEVSTSALDAEMVLAKLESAKNTLNIVILDACRDSPLGRRTRTSTKGLSNMSAARGTIIAFSTAPGQVALDGSGNNSPYTKHLINAIGKRGLLLEQVFKEVRGNVIKETKGTQVPWENSSILGDFYFFSY